MLSHVSAFPTGLESWSFKKHAKGGCRGVKKLSNTAEFSSNTPKS